VYIGKRPTYLHSKKGGKKTIRINEDLHTLQGFEPW